MRALKLATIALLTSASVLGACAIDDVQDLSKVEQDLEFFGLITCMVAGPGGRVEDFENCRTDEVSLSVKRVTARLDERVAALMIPAGQQRYRWTVTSADGAHTVAFGCKTGKDCAFDVKPECTRRATNKVFFITLEVRNSAGGEPLTRTIKATIPNPTNCDVFSDCEDRPAAAPVLSIASDFCGGMHRTFFTQVPGQTHTQVQTKPRLDAGLGIGPTFSWNLVSTGYEYPGITVDQAFGPCYGDASASFYQRARACNACGCGPWSNEAYFAYFSGECR